MAPRGRSRGRGRGRGGGYSAAQQQLKKTRPHPALLMTQDLLAWILVDNTPVTIYSKSESTEGGRRVKGKIVAKEGLEFGIGFRDERTSGEDVCVDVVVDGVVSRADREIFRCASREYQQRSYTWRGRKDSSGTIRHFLFQPLSLTDEVDIACNSENVVKSIGTIQLRVCRIKVTGKVEEGDAEGREFVNEEPPVLHEQSKKARVSHQAGLGPSLPHVASSRSSFEWVDQPDTPFVVFEFSYLSRTLLELEGIVIPPSPPPAPSPAASRADSKKPAPPSGPDRKPSRPSTSSSAAGTPPPRSSAKPLLPNDKGKGRESSSAAVAARLLRDRSGSLEIMDPPPAPAPGLRVQGAASSSKERERLERLERENREMKAELERLRRGRLAEAEDGSGSAAKRARVEEDEKSRRARERSKGKGKAKEVEEVVIVDSDSD